MENDKDLAVHEIIGLIRYLLACAGHDASFDLKAHIPRMKKMIEDYDEAVSKENFKARFQIWEEEGSCSVPVQFAEEVAALQSKAGGEE